jgi:hypothetical protein
MRVWVIQHPDVWRMVEHWLNYEASELWVLVAQVTWHGYNAKPNARHGLHRLHVVDALSNFGLQETFGDQHAVVCIVTDRPAATLCW